MPAPTALARRPLDPQPAGFTGDMYPAPIKGLTMRTSLYDQDPKTALVLRNALCRRYGVELRRGYRRWTTNLPGEVRSLMSYYPPRGAGSTYALKLWAGVSDGKIYDVTSQSAEGVTPAAAFTPPGQLEPGSFSWTMFSAGGANFLVVCSAGAGVLTYDATGGWINRTAAITGTGGAAAQFDFVMSWKNRLWFIAQNSNVAWYLPVLSVQGAASSFDFGPLLVWGGDIAAMASWTLDSGNGIDDKLVIVGRGGDVLVYQGTDPSSVSTFSIVGRWTVGKVAGGRRFLSKYGGDISIISNNGIERMSQLVGGRGLDTPGGELGMGSGEDWARYMEKIAEHVRQSAGAAYWQLVHFPGEQSAIVITPDNSTQNALQYVFGVLSGGWSEFVGIPMLSLEMHDTQLYFGTRDGKVMQMFYGDSDDLLTDGTPGVPIAAQVQTSFVALGGDAFHVKRPLMVMPMFTAPSTPSVKAQVNTDWSLQPIPGSPVYNPYALAQWDIAKWDNAVWGGGNNIFNAWVGAEGLGTHCALRMDFTGGSPGTVFTAWKLLAEVGRGVL